MLAVLIGALLSGILILGCVTGRYKRLRWAREYLYDLEELYAKIHRAGSMEELDSSALTSIRIKLEEYLPDLKEWELRRLPIDLVRDFFAKRIDRVERPIVEALERECLGYSLAGGFGFASAFVGGLLLAHSGDPALVSQGLAALSVTLPIALIGYRFYRSKKGERQLIYRMRDAVLAPSIAALRDALREAREAGSGADF